MSRLAGTCARLASGAIMMLLLGGCTVAANTIDQTEQLAAVTAVLQTDESIVLDVVSTGCTTIESIEARVEQIDDDTATLTLLQVSPDHCRRMPFSVQLEYSRASLGIEGKGFLLLNPIVPLPGRR